MHGGTYYAVIDNGAGSESSSSQVNATLLYNSGNTSGKALSNFFLKEAALGITFFILLIAGGIVIIFGFVKKDKSKDAEMQTSATTQPKQKDMTDQQIDELYKKIKKKAQKE
jgi:putative Mn2+ efflux pump MntP